VLLPTKDPSLLYNKAIADLQQAAALEPPGVLRSYAWLNLGIALMHFGQYEAAVRDAFKKADLPDRPGISRGTVRYLVALCYEKLGLQKEAGTAYQEAATSSTATLVSHDGPALAPSAKRRSALLLQSK
jgi:tetratricopeptide (TPR) repeat protein